VAFFILKFMPSVGKQWMNKLSHPRFKCLLKLKFFLMSLHLFIEVAEIASLSSHFRSMMDRIRSLMDEIRGKEQSLRASELKTLYSQIKNF
jgi:sensor histidine kinase YesM